LALVLHQAVNNPDANRIFVVYEGVMPDLLQNEAQAIMTGKIGEDGIFYASELLLKCPTKYEEAVPEQSANS
jgi:cytochrome c-type biogenesis protein CcmE